MKSAFEAKHLEDAGCLPSPSAEAPPIKEIPAALRLASRVVPPLSLLLVAAMVLGSCLFYLQARQGDDRVAA